MPVDHSARGPLEGPESKPLISLEKPSETPCLSLTTSGLHSAQGPHCRAGFISRQKSVLQQGQGREDQQGAEVRFQNVAGFPTCL